jgi:hypothetical protein
MPAVPAADTGDTAVEGNDMTGFGHNPSDSDRPLLGQLLVDAGLLSAADLESVLARQRETGAPLGRMLVDEGYVAAHSVAMALAEQHGGLLKTEYGFATGRRASEPGASEAQDPAAPQFPLLRLSNEDEAPTPVSTPPDPELAGLRLEPAAAPPEVEELVEAQAPVAPAPVAAVPDPERATLHDDMADAERRIEELGEALERATTELEASAARVHDAELARDQALTALTGAHERAVLLERNLEELSSRPPETSGRTYSDERHTLFVPGTGGYKAVERSGPAPEPGTEVAMSDEAKFRVVRIGPSPLPGETHPHVYLDRIGPSWSELA